LYVFNLLKSVWVCSKDMIVRLKANALRLAVSDYTTQQARDVEETYLGYVELTVADAVVDRTLAQGRERAALAGRLPTNPSKSEQQGHGPTDDAPQAPSFADAALLEDGEITPVAAVNPPVTVSEPLAGSTVPSEDSILSESYVQELVAQRGDINANYFALLHAQSDDEHVALARFVPEVSQAHEETETERQVRLATTDKVAADEAGELRRIIDRKLHLKAIDVERTVWNVTARSVQQVSRLG
jgi:predicted ribonuclease YlaK